MNIIKEEKFLNYDIIEYDVVDTTMNVVKNFKANTIVIAQKQTSGKGKGNRVWNSENNNNLYFSLIIEANNNKLDYSQVSFITSVAMKYAISEFDNKNNSIISKWPNDILINNKKAVGILLEFDNNKLIIGPGVNINFFPDNVNFNATSLKNEGIIVDKYTLLKRFLANFDYLFKEWEQNGFSSIRMKWLKSSYKLHQTIKVGDIEGIFEDIDNDGTLIVKMANGKYHFVKSGDVF
mgnify:FL=1